MLNPIRTNSYCKLLKRCLMPIAFVCCVFTSQFAAAGWNDFACENGEELSTADMDITFASGGWLNPAELDAERLIDGKWDGWAPNYSGSATAVITINEMVQVSELQFFTATASGTIDLTTAEGNQSINLAGNYDWQTVSLNANIAQFSLTRNNTNENIVELKVCVQTGNTDQDNPNDDENPDSDVDDDNPTNEDGDGAFAMLPHTDSNGRLVTGQSSGLPTAYAFGQWSATPGVAGTLSQACIDLHDSYWVEGSDGVAYPTWHPAAVIHPSSGEGCVFGHEHGDDPSNAPVWMFEYSGGWPPFGRVLEHHSGMRHEDHFGHKVTVSHFRAAIGNTANSHEAMYDAGFDCHFISKIHQGSFSEDALSNHLHEYFLSIACDDDPGVTANRQLRTQASIKTLVPFGAPNVFENRCLSENPPGNDLFFSTNVIGLDGSSTLSPAQQNTPVPDAGEINNREFTCLNAAEGRIQHGSPDYVDFTDLWHQNHRVRGPGGVSFEFNPYYIVKDAVRVHTVPVDSNGTRLGNGRVQYTIDACADNAESNLAYCDGAYKSGGGVHSPFSILSPFRGALRAINFKSFNIYNNSQARGNDEFCADANGNYLPSATISNKNCSSGIYQKITNGFNGNSNMWSWRNAQTGVIGPVIGAFEIYGQAIRYPNPDLVNNPGQPFIFGLRRPDANGQGCPRGDLNFPSGNPDRAFCPTGIGFERIIDKRDSVPQSIKNAVAYNPATGVQYNTDLHAPN